MTQQDLGDWSADEVRLLVGLVGEGAAAIPALRPGLLSVIGQSRGVSLAVLHVPSSTADALIKTHCAQWMISGEAQRLVATEKGRACAQTLLTMKKERTGPEIIEIRAGDEIQPVLRNPRESPLAWLARRKGKDGRPLLDPIFFAAGERLREDFSRAGLSPRMGVDWERFGTAVSSSGSAMMTATETMIAARQRVSRAMDEVGPEMAGLLLDVCCFLKSLETVERERGWPQRSAKLVLAIALGRLAAHYGFDRPIRGVAVKGAVFTWHDSANAG